MDTAGAGSPVQTMIAITDTTLSTQVMTATIANQTAMAAPITIILVQVVLHVKECITWSPVILEIIVQSNGGLF